MTKELLFRGALFDMGGFSRMTREICPRLAKDGWKVRIDPLATGSPDQLDPETRDQVMPLVGTPLEGDSFPLVVAFTAMPTEKRTGKTFFYTMTESQRPHPLLVERCNAHADEVWVPASFHEKGFREGGVTKPIKTIPLGVDPERFKPGEPPKKATYEEIGSGRIVNEPPKCFRFMALYAHNLHKGPDILMQAFLRSFSNRDGVCLVIYSRYGGGTSPACRNVVRTHLKAYRASFGRPDSAPVYWCGDEFAPKDMPGLYCGADCFVSCSRGEGFSLSQIEAAACGVPVVSSYTSGTTQYLDDSVAFLVRPEGTAIADARLESVSPFFKGQKFDVLGWKSAAEFGARMRQVLSDRQLAARKAAAFRERVLREFTWDLCAKRVGEALEAT